MQFLNYYYFTIILSSSIINLILFLSTTTSAARYINNSDETKYSELGDYPNFSKTIRVDKSGRGNFTTLQKAIDSIPKNNSFWVRIHVKAGLYFEKVVIEKEKQYIFLEGESSRKTIISWGDSGSIIKSPTFTMFADNFVASKIAFKNHYNHVKAVDKGKRITWAPAAIIAADKVSFYECAFIGVQDTLFDARGRHYFEYCYIEGALDFIFGDGQSYYERCKLNVTTRLLGPGRHKGYITAQGRESAEESSGFVFRFNSIIGFGTGPTFLGRAYRNHSRVFFYKTYMDNNITPEGWSAWKNVGHEESITYAEEGCFGPGSDKSRRVNWEKTLSVDEKNQLINVNNFINEDGWMQKQPLKPMTNNVTI